MRVVFDREVFTAAFHSICHAVPSRTTHDVLLNVKIVAKDGVIALQATDTRVDMSLVVSGAIDSEGAVLVHAGRMSRILKHLTDHRIVIYKDGEYIRLFCGYAEFLMSDAGAEEFPPIAAFPDEIATMNSGELKRLIGRTIIATDAESTRYALGGILMELGTGLATFVATDSRRLIVATGSCSESVHRIHHDRPVAPRQMMELVANRLPDDAVARIGWNGLRIAVQWEGVTIVSEAIQGRFPDYRKVVPTTFSRTVDVDAAQLSTVAKLSRIMTNEERRGADLELSPGCLKLSTAAYENRCRVEMPVAYDGDVIKAFYDPRYIAEFLHVCIDQGIERCAIKWAGDREDPVMLEVDGCQCLIMPMSRDQQ